MAGLRKYIRPYYSYMLLAMFIKFLGALVELLIPYLLETILDDVVPTGSRRGILLTGGAMVLCAALCVTANIVANRMSAISAGRITLVLRHDLFQRLDRLSARQLDGLTLPSAVSRLTSDTYNVNQLLARMQRLGVRGPILLLGGVCITLHMDAGLAMVLIATLPLIGLLVYFVTKTSVPLYTKEQGILDRMVRVVQENITGIRVIKALSKTEYETRRFGEVNQQLCQVDQKVGGHYGSDQSCRHPDFEPGSHRRGPGRGLPGKRRTHPARCDHCISELLHHDSQRYAGGYQNFHHLVQGRGQRQAGGGGAGAAGGSDGGSLRRTVRVLFGVPGRELLV